MPRPHSFAQPRTTTRDRHQSRIRRSNTRTRRRPSSRPAHRGSSRRRRERPPAASVDATHGVAQGIAAGWNRFDRVADAAKAIGRRDAPPGRHRHVADDDLTPPVREAAHPSRKIAAEKLLLFRHRQRGQRQALKRRRPTGELIDKGRIGCRSSTGSEGREWPALRLQRRLLYEKEWSHRA